MFSFNSHTITLLTPNAISKYAIIQQCIRHHSWIRVVCAFFYRISMAAFRPLLAVAMGELARTCPVHKPEVTSEIEEYLSKYIAGNCTFAEIQPEFVKLAGSDAVLAKVRAILEVDDKPLPPAPETFVSNTSRNQIVARKKARPWSEEEDIRLLAAINKFGLDAWGAVTAFVGSGRTRSQCSQRWVRGLDPRISKVVWTQAEDQKLLDLVKEYGDRSWTRIANTLGNRSDAQCRYRYGQLVKEGAGNGATGSMVTEVASVPAVVLTRESNLLTRCRSQKLPPITDFLKQGGVTDFGIHALNIY